MCSIDFSRSHRNSLSLLSSLLFFFWHMHCRQTPLGKTFNRLSPCMCFSVTDGFIMLTIDVPNESNRARNHPKPTKIHTQESPTTIPTSTSHILYVSNRYMQIRLLTDWTCYSTRITRKYLSSERLKSTRNLSEFVVQSHLHFI